MLSAMDDGTLSARAMLAPFWDLYALGRECASPYFHSALSWPEACILLQHLIHFSGKMNDVLAAIITPAAVPMLPSVSRHPISRKDASPRLYLHSASRTDAPPYVCRFIPSAFGIPSPTVGSILWAKKM